MNIWKNKVVVVTGGTQGLGLAIANEFATQGARTVVLSRHAPEAGGDSSMPHHWVEADVTLDASVASAVETVRSKFGQIDVWVNNVGVSTRTAILECGVEEYRRLMELNFYSAVRCALAVMPSLEETAGVLINVGSLASKTGWPWVAPYATSKHALAAFHHQLRLEGPDAVHFLLVCPGPIQREDAGQRYSDSTQGLAGQADQPGAGVKLKGIDPQWLARKLVRCAHQRKHELVVPGYSRLAFAILQLWPGLGDWLLKRSTRSGD